MGLEPYGLTLIRCQAEDFTLHRTVLEKPCRHSKRIYLRVKKPRGMQLTSHEQGITLTDLHRSERDLTLHRGEEITHYREILPHMRFEVTVHKPKLNHVPGRLLGKALTEGPMDRYTLRELLLPQFPHLTLEALEESIVRWNQDEQGPHLLLNHHVQWTRVPWHRLKKQGPAVPAGSSLDYTHHALLFWKQHFEEVPREVFLQDFEGHEKDFHTKMQVREQLPGWMGFTASDWLQQKTPSAFLSTLGHQLRLQDQVVWVYPHKLPDGDVLITTSPTGTHTVRVEQGKFCNNTATMFPSASVHHPELKGLLETVLRLGRKPSGQEKAEKGTTVTLGVVGWLMHRDLKALTQKT